MQSVNPSDLNSKGAEAPFAATQDPTFDALFKLAIQGDPRVYFAAIPLRLIRPYAPEFNFLMLPGGEAIIAAIIAQARQGHFPRLWVYEKDNTFVMSDDYPKYHACILGQPDYVPCWVLGYPQHIAAKDVQGPVDAREAAGISP